MTEKQPSAIGGRPYYEFRPLDEDSAFPCPWCKSERVVERLVDPGDGCSDMQFWCRGCHRDWWVFGSDDESPPACWPLWFRIKARLGYMTEQVK